MEFVGGNNFGFPKVLFAIFLLAFGVVIATWITGNWRILFPPKEKEESISQINNLQITSIYNEENISLTYLDLYRNSAHAWERHQDGATKAIECLEKNGSVKQYLTHFVNKNGDKIQTETFLCFEPFSKLYYAVVLIVEEGRRIGILVTAYEVVKKYATETLFTAYLYENFSAEISKLAIKAGELIVMYSR